MEQGDVYQHDKSKRLYEVLIPKALREEDPKKEVVVYRLYKPIVEDTPIWVRDRQEFKKKFTKVKDPGLFVLDL